MLKGIFLTVLWPLAALGCGGSPPAAAAGLGEAVTVAYSGEISAAHNRQFFAALAGTPARLRITSGGGEVAAGIALGRWVHDHGLDVEVAGYCLSSCANYVFPAGRRKVILPGAVVAWHGNYRHLKETGQWGGDVAHRMAAHGEDRATARRRAREQLDRLVALERAFFARIGVNEYLCWIGKMPPFEVPDYYSMSPRDMARFGVDGVTAPPDYEATASSATGMDIRFIELDGKVAAP